jgi:hemoglobin
MPLFERIKKIFKRNQKQRSFFEAIGDENGVHELVKNFYYVMESDPKAKECLEVHELVDGKIPDEVKKKLFLFLTGWFGGPQIYTKTYGPPRMRARHAHVKITEKERDQWLYCMDIALKKHSAKMSKLEKKLFLNSFKALALRIQNT